MDSALQRSFKKTFSEAKRRRTESKRDFIIVETNDIISKKFKICSADKFFDKGANFNTIVCYMSYPEDGSEE